MIQEHTIIIQSNDLCHKTYVPKSAFLWISDDFLDLEDNLRNIPNFWWFSWFGRQHVKHFPSFGNSLQAKKINIKGIINRKEGVCHGNPVNSYLIEKYTYQYYVTLKVERKNMKFKSLIESSKVAWDDGHISSKVALTCIIKLWIWCSSWQFGN